VRSIRRPATSIEAVIPSIATISGRPASVGVAPVVACRNSGTNTLIANGDAVARSMAALANATSGLRSRPRGTIGSALRRSRTTSAPARTAVAARRATIVVEPHG
jgi:hypothetical protein